MTELTILMPCLNEAETIETCIRKARGYLERSGISGEIVIADNGSTDGSQARAEALGARVVDVPARAMARPLGRRDRGGARPLFVIMATADDSYDFSRLDAFVEKLRGGADLCDGATASGAASPPSAMPPLHRYLGKPRASRPSARVLVPRARSGISTAAWRGFFAPGDPWSEAEHAGQWSSPRSMVDQGHDHGAEGHRGAHHAQPPDGRSRPPHLRVGATGLATPEAASDLRCRTGSSTIPGWRFLPWGRRCSSALLGGARRDCRRDLRHRVADPRLGTRADRVSACLLLRAPARLHTVQAGLLPVSPRFERVSQQITVDQRLAQVGGILVFAGIAAAVGAVVVWGAGGMG